MLINTWNEITKESAHVSVIRGVQVNKERKEFENFFFMC